MPEPTFTEHEVMRAVQSGSEEIFGRDTLAASILAGEVAMKLMAGDIEDDVPTPEAIDWTAPPDYALRAIKSSSTKELAALIADGADRLSKSIATYCNTYANRPEESNGTISLNPIIFADGSTVGGNVIGRLSIYTTSEDPGLRGDVAAMTLHGGEDAPYDYFNDAGSSSYLARSMTIKRTHVNDPVANQKREVLYPEVNVRYYGDMFSGNDGLLFESKRGKPIEAYGRVLIADLFWALDMAITYYEGVYIAGIKHPGLTYADYREAGCLKDDLTLDFAKAESYVRSRMDENTEERSGGWPVLRNREDTMVTMDPAAREQIEKHKERLRPTIAFNQPHLLYVG